MPLYFLGKRIFDRNTGAIAAILLALNVFHIRYAQEARSYALLSLALVLATWCFVSAVESESQNKWALYAIVSAAAVYLHFFAVLVIGAHFLSVIIWKRPIPWRNIFVSAVLFRASSLARRRISSSQCSKSSTRLGEISNRPRIL